MLDKIKTRRGHLGGSVEHLEGKGGESVVAILRFLCSNIRLCRLRTEWLAPVSKYWTYRSHTGVYRPSKPISLPSIDGGFTLTDSRLSWERNWVRTQLGTDPQISQPMCCGLYREPFFSGAVALSIVVDDFMNVCHARGLPTENVCGAYVDWREKRMYRVDRVFSYMLYIDSNHRDSRIWVTACLWLSSSSNLLD
jgi:hypothetical protein